MLPGNNKTVPCVLKEPKKTRTERKEYLLSEFVGHFRYETFHCKVGGGVAGLRRNCNIFSEKGWGGRGSKAVWKFSENSSVLASGGFPKAFPTQTEFVHCS